MDKESITKEAISESWDFWLSQHPVSLGDIIEDAIKKTWCKWLDDHENEILEKIAKLKG